MVRRLFIFCCFSFFLSQSAFGQAKDSIILYNGQMLIGKVEGSTLGVITIDDNELKIQNIKLFKIKTLVIQAKFKLETVQKVFYFSKFFRSDKAGWANIQDANGNSIPLPIKDIFQLISMDKNFLQRLNGNISAGFSFTKSSSIGQANFSAALQFATKNVEYGLTASSISSLDSGKFTRDNENLQLFAGYDLNAAWFIAGVGQYQRNLELSIARRYVEILGIGNKLFIGKTGNWLQSPVLIIRSKKVLMGFPVHRRWKFR